MRKICNSQIRLLAPSQELWQSTCSGWRSRRSCEPSAYFHRSGIAKFAINACPSRYQQEYQQNDRLHRALPRTFTYVFKCAAQILLKNQESNQLCKLLLLLSFYTWCPWPAVAYFRNHLNLRSFYPSIAADTSRNTSKMTCSISSQK
jgi:hypothetical protein